MTHEHMTSHTAGLKVEVSDISPVKRSLAVEVPGDRLAEELQHTYRKYRKNLRVPGFREGKVPDHVIRQRFGREIEQEAVEHVISHALQDAITQAGLSPLRTPVLKDYTHTPGVSVTFVAELEVLPAVEARGYREIRVKTPDPAVTDRMMSEAMDALRDRAARFDPVEGRGVRPGDHVIADVKGQAGEGETFAREKLLLEIGSGGPHPELTDPLREMLPGQSRSFSVAYPKDHPAPEMAGRTIGYEVSLHEIKEKNLPDMDDEFARDLGPFQSIQELRQRVSDDLLARERRRVREESRGAIIDQLLSANPGTPAPDVLVDEEIDRRIGELAASMRMQGMDPERAEIDWEALRERQKEAAERSVRATLLLDAIASQEKIVLEPAALDEAVAAEAARRKLAPEALRAKLAKDGRLERLGSQLLREKVLDFLLASANT